MYLTQALRILADHVHVAEDIRKDVHDAIDAEAERLGEPKRAVVIADAAKAERDAKIAALKAELAKLDETGE